MRRLAYSLKLISVAMLFPIALIGCAKGGSDSHSQTGGQDGGGGQVKLSTPEEVRAAIDLAFKLGAEPDINRNIFVRFYIEWVHEAEEAKPENYQDLVKSLNGNQSEIDQLIYVPKHLFPYLLPIRDLYTFDRHDPMSIVEMGQPFDYGGYIGGTHPKEPDFKRFRSPALEALAKNARDLKVNGDCDQPNPKHADASVSSHTTHARICFSVGNLRRLAPTSLLREVLSLLLHEVSHMGGAQEVEAQVWQKLFSNYFAARFGALDNAMIAQKTAVLLDGISSYLTDAENANNRTPGSPAVFVMVGRVQQALTSLPSYLDPVMLQLTLKPKSPELVNNYSNSVLAMIQMTRHKFRIHGSDFQAKDYYVVPKLSTKEVAANLKDLENALQIVQDNFGAYVYGPEFARLSRCSLPLDPVDPREDFLYQGIASYRSIPGDGKGGLRVIVPPRECASTPAAKGAN